MNTSTHREPHSVRRRTRLSVALLGAAALTLAACGGDDAAVVAEDATDASEPAGTEPASTEPQSTEPQSTDPASTEPLGAGSAAPLPGVEEVDGVAQYRPVEVIGDVLAPAVDSGADPAVGVVAPGLNGASFDGTPVVIEPGDGTPYMLAFLAHWCPHCNAEVPRLIEWSESGGTPEGLRVVAVSTSASDQYPNYPPSEWLAELAWPWEAMADDTTGTAGTAYGLTGFPFLVIVDGDGTVLARQSGEMSVEELDAWVDDALGLG